MKFKDFIIREKLSLDTIPVHQLGWEIIFLGIGGSQAYGTNTPQSDIDYRGIFLIPQSELYGLNYVAQIALGETDNKTGEVKNDNVFYELGRFVELLMKSNPNILEILLLIILNHLI